MTNKPDCYKCKHRRGTQWGHHSSCVNGKAYVKGNAHGIRNGWFLWPINFDPVWLDSCDGFDLADASESVPTTKEKRKAKRNDNRLRSDKKERSRCGLRIKSTHKRNTEGDLSKEVDNGGPVNRTEEELSLGQYLGSIRIARNLTLRAVERATQREVSNAYLSQLEHGFIKKPSPNILYSLAEVYEVPYETLMEKAGYLTRKAEQKCEQKRKSILALDNTSLTREEEEKLLLYLAFLRFRK